MIPFPNKKYNIIYADPPWSYQDKRCNGNAADHYPTMRVEDICGLPVQNLAADKLKPTNIVDVPPRKRYSSGKTMPAWYDEAWHLPKEERAKIRSKTFPGVAAAMAEQWARNAGGLNGK